MTIKTFTATLLLTASFLLLTACNNNAKTETNTTTDTGTIIDGSDGNTTTDSGSDDNTTTGETGEDDENSTTTPTITLSSLKLTINKTSLNKDENTTVKVMAAYSDNTSQEVTDKVEWVVTPSDAVKVTNTTLTALKDVGTTVKAKMDTVASGAISLNIYWEVNGHTLPPEPDKALNDSTLLGIDANDNDVRDDVERWIYETYKDKHPIHIDIAMQAGRAYKKVLETPERAKELHDFVDAPSYCESYHKIYAKYFNEPLLVKEDITNEYFRANIIFNTPERKRAYLEYDRLLSGDTYSTPKIGEGKKLCDFNTSKYEE